jgi:excisionase family DNA binding protein
MTPQPGWYTLRELARLRGCSTSYLRQRIADGRLPAVKVGTVWVVRADYASLFLATRRRHGGIVAGCPVHGSTCRKVWHKHDSVEVQA